VLNNQIYGVDGKLLVGGKITSYRAGTTTLEETYGDVGGLVTQTNPIILNNYGMANDPIWLSEGVTYKFVVSDSNDNLMWTYDDIVGVNDTIEIGKYIGKEWVLGGAPTFIDENEFFLNGDVTDVFHFGRRVRLGILDSYVYGSTIESAFDVGTDKTLIKLLMDDGDAITDTLLTVDYGILSYAPQSYPNFLSMAQWYKKGVDLTITAGTIELWDTSGNYANVIGTGDVISMGASYQEGATKYLRFVDGGAVLKNGSTIKTPKGVDLALNSGDIIEVFAGANGVNYVAHLMSNKPILIPSYSAPLSKRQTVLIGPAEVFIGSTTTAIYYEVPPFPMTSNSTSGYVAYSNSSFMGNPYIIFDHNSGTEFRLRDNQYFGLDFPENWWINKFSWIDNYTAIQAENVRFYIKDLSGNLIQMYYSGNGSISMQTINIPLTLCKGVYVSADNVSHEDWYIRELDVYGYKEADIVSPTVTAITENLIKSVYYTKTSPTMNAASENGYIVSASSEQGANNAYKAFSGSTTSYWEAATAANEWLQMQFAYQVTINRVILTAASTNPTEMPINFNIQGSLNGTDWTILGSWGNGPIWNINESKSYDFINNTPYLYYRVLTISNGGGAKILIGECSFNTITASAEYGTIELNLSETQTIASIANGFDSEGQLDYTMALPMENKYVPIGTACVNYIYLRRDVLSGEITYEHKEFPPVYGLYQPNYLPVIPNLLRGDGANGTSFFIDSYGNTGMTTVGTVTNSSTAPKFGTGSILFGSAGSKLKIPRSMGINRDAWTIDFWWKPTSLAGNVDLIGGTPDFSLMLSYGRTASKISLYISSNGSTWDVASNIPGIKANFAIGTWYYIKIAFSSRRYQVWVDGTQDINVVSSLKMTQISSLNIGAYAAEASTACGFIDDFRFRPAKYDFNGQVLDTVPTAAVPYVKPWIFNINEMNGYEKEEDGTFTDVQMVCLGEAASFSSTSYTVTPTTYAYNGRKQIAWSTFDPTVDSWVDIPHNIGCDLIDPELNVNSPTAASPYDNQSIIPIDSTGMVSGTNVFSGIPVGVMITSTLYRLRWPANVSADTLNAYGGSGVSAIITSGAINLSGIIERAF